MGRYLPGMEHLCDRVLGHMLRESWIGRDDTQALAADVLDRGLGFQPAAER